MVLASGLIAWLKSDSFIASGEYLHKQAVTVLFQHCDHQNPVKTSQKLLGVSQTEFCIKFIL